jgi:hypothetical protein
MRIMCIQCLAETNLPPGADPHASTWCQCCTIDHHHGESVMAAEACAEANHPGVPCFSPPGQPVRPDGCTVCRPVMHFAVAGDLTLTVG